jgi:Arc/MetJ family transcription regulator
MNKMLKRTTIYLDPKLHQAIRIKAIQVSASVSDLVNKAIRLALKEDAIDLEAVKSRAKEPARAFEDVLHDLKKDGLI